MIKKCYIYPKKTFSINTKGKIHTLENVGPGETLCCCCNINLSNVTPDYFPINLDWFFKFNDIGVNIKGVILRKTKIKFYQDIEP